MFAWICFRLLEKLHQKQHFFGQPMCWKLYLIQALRGHTIQQLTSFLNLGQDPPPTNGVCATKRDLAVECFFSSRCIPSAFSKCKNSILMVLMHIDGYRCTDVCFFQNMQISHNNTPEMFIISAFESPNTTPHDRLLSCPEGSTPFGTSTHFSEEASASLVHVLLQPLVQLLRLHPIPKKMVPGCRVSPTQQLQ